MAKVFATAQRVKHASGGLLYGSFIYRLVSLIADFVYRQVNRSLLAGFFTRELRSGALLENSRAYRAVFKNPGKLMRGFKNFVGGLYEKSVFNYSLGRFTRLLFSTSVRSVAGCCIVFGASAVAISSVQLFSGQITTLLGSGNYVAAVSVLIGLLLFPSTDTLSETLLRSRLFRFFILEVAGIRKDQFHVDGPGVYRPLPFALLGIFLAAIAVYVPVWLIVIGFFGALLAALILKSCEFGALLIVTLLPFTPTTMMAGLAIITLISYLFKFARGKRVMRFDGMDMAVVLFSLMLLYGGLGSFQPKSSLPVTAIQLCFVSVYFVLSNTIRAKHLAMKAVWALMIGGCVSALMGIYQYVGGFAQSLIWVDVKMFGSISGRVIGPFDNPNVFGEYLVLLLPVAAALVFTQKGLRRLFALFAFGVMGLSLIFTFSRGAWLAFLLTFVMFLVCYSRTFFKLGMAGVFAVPFLPYVLPATVVSRFMSIGNLKDTSTAYRVSVWEGSLRMFRDFWATGIGAGSDVFLQVYPSYALAGAAYALHSHNLFLQVAIELGLGGLIALLLVVLLFARMVFSGSAAISDKKSSALLLAFGAGVLAMLIQGMTDNIWYNFRIFLLFWMALGVAAGLRRSCYEEAGETP